MNNRLIPFLGGGLVVVLIVAGILLFLRNGDLVNRTEDPSQSEEAVQLSDTERYVQEMPQVLDQFQAWQSGPLALRTETLERKMEEPAPFANMTFGQMLLLYLNARTSGRGDTLSMDWVASETLAPTLQPIYESIVADGIPIQSRLNELTPPDAMEPAHAALQACVAYEIERSQNLADVLSGVSEPSDAEERSVNLCLGIQTSVDDLRAYLATADPE